MLRFHIETASLSLRNTDSDVSKILHGESTLNKGLTHILNAADHVKNFRSKLNEVECAALFGVATLVELFNLALIF